MSDLLGKKGSNMKAASYFPCWIYGKITFIFVKDYSRLYIEKIDIFGIDFPLIKGIFNKKYMTFKNVLF